MLLPYSSKWPHKHMLLPWLRETDAFAAEATDLLHFATQPKHNTSCCKCCCCCWASLTLVWL